MSTIHHQYRAYHIAFHSGRYHVQNDANPHDPYCDVTLQLPNLNTARRYVDTLWDMMLDPQPEPYNSLRLEPFYKCGYRPDGPLPSLYRVQSNHVAGTCAHVSCQTTTVGLAAGNCWHYCGKPVANPGTTRCLAHSDFPERWTPEPTLDVD